MKKYLFFLLVTILMLFMCAVSLSAQESKKNNDKSEPEQFAAPLKTNTDSSNPARIAILGVFHFAGSSGDAASMKIYGILDERRQKEIEEVLIRLENYKPDKILVEYPYSENERLNNDYQEYLIGNFELTEMEIHQLGFKLAERLGHKRIYGVDHRLTLPSDKLQAFAETHGKKEILEKLIADVKTFAEKESKNLEAISILDSLTKMNTDESDQWNRSMYLGTIIEMGDELSNPGVDFTETWYKRNLFILANIMKSVEPGERLLLIMGSGHRAILKPFIKDKNDLRYDEIHDYLK